MPADTLMHEPDRTQDTDKIDDSGIAAEQPREPIGSTRDARQCHESAGPNQPAATFISARRWALPTSRSQLAST
jgi:hypothetical protein